jgi:hypothetical protein
MAIVTQILQGFNLLAATLRHFRFFRAPRENPSPFLYFLSLIGSGTWYFSIATIRDLSVLITPIFTIYCLYLIVKKLNSAQAHAEPSIKGPTVYNSKININLWLSEIEEYLDAKRINRDMDKRDAVLDKLDTRTRATIQKLIDNNKL